MFEQLEESATANPKKFGKVLLFVFAGIALVVAGVCSYAPVETGHVGVVYGFGGKIVGDLDPGPHFIPPWQSVRVLNVQIQNAKFHNPNNKQEKDTPVDYLGRIGAASRESQDVYFDVTLNWSISAGDAVKLYSELGPDFFAKIVPSQMNQYFKAETVKYEATEALQNREKIRNDVTQAMTPVLGAYGIRLVSLQIDNIDFNGDFKSAIERKQIATQEAQAAANQVAIAKANADRAVADARGKADSAIEAARGEAESIRIKAQAQADANSKISSSLTDQLIRSRAVENLQNVKGFILPSTGNFLFDPTNALK